ncbi:butyrophilin subfamily 1 member A1-like isoform 4-T4 [Menidia menidia]
MGKTTKKQVDTFPLRTLCFCLASFWFPVRGLSLIGSSEPVAVAPGEDAVLPCRLDPREDARLLTVEWSRPDLRLRGAGGPRADVVLVLRGGREVRDVVLRAYRNRTALLPGGPPRGDLSLRISRVRPQDAGQYRCLLPRPGRHAHATLLVDPKFARIPTTPASTTPEPEDDPPERRRTHLPAVVAAVAMVTAVLGAVATAVLGRFCVRRREQNKNLQRPIGT